MTVSATYTANTSQGSNIVVSGSGNVATTFLKVAGYPQINFGVGTTSAWAMSACGSRWCMTSPVRWTMTAR